jgi:3-hydroxyisobutyrate dehydrogenase
MNMRVGFIGLGQLGKAMARRLLNQGIELTVWNRSRAKADDLNVVSAASPNELISNVDVVFLSLFDSNAVADVLNGENGLLSGECEGKIIIDTTTNHFKPVVTFHQRVRERGASYLEAPVLGSVMPASKGELSVVVSGDRNVLEQVRPIIEHLGKKIYFLEQPGLATKMKLVNNLVLGSFMAVLAEALVLGERSGIDKPTVLDILGAGAGNSGVLNAKREKLLAGDFSPHFSAALIHKDLGYLQELSESVGYSARTAPVVREMFAAVLYHRLQDQDFSVVYKTLQGQLPK